jgi:Flp pilus assembly protein TadG
MLALWSNLRDAWRAFCNERSGNVAVTFAMATLPIIGGVGAAVDYSRANAVKASLQAALDSTALMLSREAATDSADQLQTNALKYFKANYTPANTNDIAVSASYTTNGGTEITVNASVDVPTVFMGIMGYTSITVNGSSTAKWGSQRLRVALALDNTGSMAQDGKMTALKSATKALLDQLKAAATKDGDVYVSIIPFSKDVNVGNSKTNRSADWLDWSLWDEKNGDCSDNNLREPSQDLDRRQAQELERLRHRSRRHAGAGHDLRLRPVGGEPRSEKAGFAVSGRAVRPVPGRDDGPELRLDRHDRPREFDDAERQYQSADRARLGLAVAGRGRAAHRSREGSQLRVSGRHRADVGRPEHREPVVEQPERG